MATHIGASSPQANKQFSKALSAMAVRQPTPLRSLSGPMPSHDDAMRKLRQQSTNDMPIVQVTELSKGPGTNVQLDCAHVVKLRAVMGDRNAEGLGASLRYSSMEINIDMATLPISAGGKMSQQRTPHSLRMNATNQLKGGLPRFRWQRCLTHLAGARGEQDGTDWILPLSTDPEFGEMMVNPVVAPAFNRHFVVSGSDIIQGGQQLGSVVTTDRMLLSHIDALAAIWDEMPVKMSPIIIPGDDAGGEDLIKGVLYVDPLVWDSLLTDTTANNNFRQWQANAMQRASYGSLAKHPLFAGGPLFWNGILVRKMHFGIRFGASSVQRHIPQANRLTAVETNVTVAAGLSTTHVVARSIFMGAQALAVASGGNQTSEETYSLLENRTNFGRNLELAGEVIGAEEKMRFSLPNSAGDLEPTDIGVLVLDSVVRRRLVA
ncbi:Protein of unknown function DUF4043 [uncultured Caudovirales phage]|uniref:Major capsid protein n=1 Tax=uncultured Caudovirales phage TaxID=2100421 RepID=A0A6J5NGS1_9CAUD|nr:Protein of unknown function DUF4043 [uncultured Caudovirales phage]